MHAILTNRIADILHYNDKYEYLTDEEILPSNQKQIMKLAKFEKQIKQLKIKEKNKLRF